MSWFRNIWRVSGLSFAIAIPAWGTVQFFDYELPDYPVAASSCQSAADQLGERLKLATGVEVYQASCSTAGASSSKIKITYLAEAALTVESTHNHLFGSLFSGGLYLNRGACAADLAEQVQLFRKGTGLEPFISYCYPVGQFSNESHGLRIEAFGEATRHPYLSDGTFYKGKSLEDPTRLASRIFDMAKLQGVDMAFAAVVPAWPYYSVVIRYYSDISVSFSVTSPMTFDSASACADGVAALEKLNQQAVVVPLALFCSAWPGETAEVALNQVSLRPSGIFQVTAPDLFTTSAACQQKLPHIERLYRDTLKRNVVGTICDGKRGLYQAQVFIKGRAIPQN